MNNLSVSLELNGVIHNGLITVNDINNQEEVNNKYQKWAEQLTKDLYGYDSNLVLTTKPHITKSEA